MTTVYEEFEKELELNDQEYQEMPELPVEEKWRKYFDNRQTDNDDAQSIKKHYFDSLQPYYLAHGSYGAASKPSLEVYQQWSLELEKNPADFYHNRLFDYMVQSTRALASFLNTRPSNLILIKNVEFALQAVLRSLILSENDNVLCFDLNYGAVKTSIEQITKDVGALYFQIAMMFPANNQSIIQDLKSFLESHDHKAHPIKVAVFEHITSPTAILLPINEMIEICRRYNIKTLIDGAHGIGQIELDFEKLKADYYTSNLHKWFMSPRGVAFLHVGDPGNHQTLKPLLVSWGHSYSMNSKFIWQGTDDYSAFLSIPTQIRFFHHLGGYKAVKRNHELAKWSGNVLSRVWNTRTLVETSMISCMVVVELPPCFINETGRTERNKILYKVKTDFKIEAPMFDFKDVRYIRVSCHVYNCKQEILYLAKAVLLSLYYPSEHEYFKVLNEYNC